MSALYLLDTTKIFGEDQDYADLVDGVLENVLPSHHLLPNPHSKLKYYYFIFIYFGSNVVFVIIVY